MARAGIEENITQEDMLEILVSQYVKGIEELKNTGQVANGILGKAVQATYDKYGVRHGKGALRKYLLHGDIDSFTRQSNARANIDYYMTQEEALNTIIENMVERETNSIAKTVQFTEANINQMPKRYFDAVELAEVKLPAENQKNIITRAIEWIKNRVLERRQQRNNIKENENIQSKENQEFER